MNADQQLRQAPAHTTTSREATPRGVVLLIHGPGKVSQIAAMELAGNFEPAGWSTRVVRADRIAPRTQHVDLVVGIDADIAAFRTAALFQAPVLTTSCGDRLAADHLPDSIDDLDMRTSPLGLATIDRGSPTPIVQRAIVTAVDPDAELIWTSPITHQLSLDRITHIAVDVPEPIDRGSGVRTGSAAMGAVMTFRSPQDASSVLLHPDDDYSITTRDGTDIIIHIDQYLHQRARRVRLRAHPTGLRVVHDPTGTTT